MGIWWVPPDPHFLCALPIQENLLSLPILIEFKIYKCSLFKKFFLGGPGPPAPPSPGLPL